MAEIVRCSWADGDDLMAAYHDDEWGYAERDSRALWEKLILDGHQAGLSWITILRKRETMREAFEGFDPSIIASYGEGDIARLLENPGIIRSRAKIIATIGNAQAFLAMQERGEDFSRFTWSFVNDMPQVFERTGIGDVPAKTEISEALSKALKQRGFKFVGPTIVYAWMQAVGMVDDHVATCFRRQAN
jgi:DNA-3-methyladenine glycosylase I